MENKYFAGFIPDEDWGEIKENTFREFKVGEWWSEVAQATYDLLLRAGKTKQDALKMTQEEIKTYLNENYGDAKNKDRRTI